jgi:hypothetical protein
MRGTMAKAKCEEIVIECDLKGNFSDEFKDELLGIISETIVEIIQKRTFVDNKGVFQLKNQEQMINELLED